MAHSHIPGAVCDIPTKKECDAAYADWQAAQQVALAARVVRAGRAGEYRRDVSVFGQLVQCLAGTKETITAGDGEESRQAFTKRVLAMLDRYRSEHPGGIAQEAS